MDAVLQADTMDAVLQDATMMLCYNMLIGCCLILWYNGSTSSCYQPAMKYVLRDDVMDTVL